MQATYLDVKRCSKHVSGRVDAVAIERWLAPPPQRTEGDIIRVKSARRIMQRNQSNELARVNLVARTKQGIKVAHQAATAGSKASRAEQEALLQLRQSCESVYEGIPLPEGQPEVPEVKTLKKKLELLRKQEACLKMAISNAVLQAQALMG